MTGCSPAGQGGTWTPGQAASASAAQLDRGLVRRSACFAASLAAGVDPHPAATSPTATMTPLRKRHLSGKRWNRWRGVSRRLCGAESHGCVRGLSGSLHALRRDRRQGRAPLVISFGESQPTPLAATEGQPRAAISSRDAVVSPSAGIHRRRASGHLPPEDLKAAWLALVRAEDFARYE